MEHKVVRCIDNSNREKELTFDKDYDVLSCEGGFYQVNNDKGSSMFYMKDRFVDAESLENQETAKILDSGERTCFSTGAVRDMREGKGRCDLIPLEVVYSMLDDEVIDFLNDYKKSDNIKGKINNLYLALEAFCNDRYENVETMLLEVAKHFEEGAKKYRENNWQKGLPRWCYLDSAIRHYLKYLRGDKDEPHDRAFVWNVMCLIWTIQNIKEDDK